MSLLIYAESADGKFKKVAFELASYAKKVAESLGTTVTAVTVNAGNADKEKCLVKEAIHKEVIAVQKGTEEVKFYI